jgi:hypothetical protein
MPEEKRPDLRQQLRESLAWYEEVLGRIKEGAIVAPGEQERLMEEASPWLTFSISLVRARTSPPARPGTGRGQFEGGAGGPRPLQRERHDLPVAAVATVAKDD